MSTADVQTMASFESNDPVALRTPLYPIISIFGLLIVIGTFMTWATVESETMKETVSGLDAGGWGLSALIAGLVIMALGVLGYFWNPFSDPEALLIAGFSAAVLLGAIIKMVDATSLFTLNTTLADFFEASAGPGLWLIAIGSLLSLVSGLWIAFSRPKA